MSPTQFTPDKEPRTAKIIDFFTARDEFLRDRHETSEAIRPAARKIAWRYDPVRDRYQGIVVAIMIALTILAAVTMYMINSS